MTKQDVYSQNIKLAADAAIFTVEGGQLMVLMVQIRYPEEYTGKWALPGGLLADNETSADAVQRVLQVHCNVGNVHVEQLGAFDSLKRDPRSRAVSIVHMALVPKLDKPLAVSEKYLDVRWWPVAALPKQVGYDHETVIRAAVERLREKLATGDIAWSLLPKEFSLSQLQAVYESVLGRGLDKRNFRKRILAMGFLAETGKMSSGGAHRPAALYRFMKRKTSATEAW